MSEMDTKFLINAIISETIDGGTPQSFSYDEAGRLTDDGTLAYTWDRADRLLKTEDGVTTINYEYNGLGHRVKQDTTEYLLDAMQGLPRVIADKTGSTVNRYVFSDHGLLRHQKPDSSWVHPLRDGLGSVRHIVDASLDTVYSVNHTPYGERWNAQGSSPMSFGFTEEWQDPNDLLFLRARYYNPAQAAFLSLDPLEGGLNDVQALNRYGYVQANPANFVDPTGMVGELPPIGCGGGFPSQNTPCTVNTNDDISDLRKMLKQYQVYIGSICDWESYTPWGVTKNNNSHSQNALDAITETLEAVEDAANRLGNLYQTSPQSIFMQFMPAPIRLEIDNSLGLKLMQSNPSGLIKINYASIPSIDPKPCNKCFYNVLIHELGHMVDFAATLRLGFNPLPSNTSTYGYSVLGTYAAHSLAEFDVAGLQSDLGFFAFSDENNAEYVADIIGNWFAGTIRTGANMERLAEATVTFALLTDPQIVEEIIKELLEVVNGVL